LCIYFNMKGTHPPVVHNLQATSTGRGAIGAVATAKVHMGAQWLAKS
jgi:hypothetical protein